MPVSASTKTGQRKLHRSKEKLEDMPLRKVINEAKRKKENELNLDSIWVKEQNKSPERSKSNDTARLSFSMNDEAV